MAGSSGLAEIGEPVPAAEKEELVDDADLELDEDFLRRIREV
jgi:hypothetical protein